MLDALFDRRSIRRYKPLPVEPEKMELILKAAMYAPSACNRRPWHFIVCDERATLDAIMSTHPYASMLKDAGAAIVVCGDTRLEQPGYHVIDCSAATENILLAAHSLGLGACWLGVAPRLERMDSISQLFGLPEQVRPVSIVALGYPDETPKRPERYIPERVHKNRW